MVLLKDQVAQGTATVERLGEQAKEDVKKMHEEGMYKVVWKCEAVPMDPANPASQRYNILDEELPKICRLYGGSELPGTAPRNPGESRLKACLEKHK